VDLLASPNKGMSKGEGKMYVARLKCGCIASAWLGNKNEPELQDALKDWLKNGYVVKDENRTSISAEKCEKHKKS